MHDFVKLQGKLILQANRYDFFQALRLIERAHPDQPRIGQSLRPRDDALRFGQNVQMAFHPSTLEKFLPAREGRPAKLTVNFMGLLGSHGPLPLHLTEYTYDRQHNFGDHTISRFLDIFHHRMVSLFYRARAAAEPAISLDRPATDRFSDYLGSLFGIGMPALRNRDAVADFAKLHFTGLLANRTRNAQGLISILQEFFKLPVKIEQFVGQWLPLEADTCTYLGAWNGSSRLGHSTMLGKRVWDCQHKFCIVVGPIKYAEYVRFLPGGENMQSLIDWVRNYIGDTLNWEVRFLLKKEEIPPFSLRGVNRLGWSTWFNTNTSRRTSGQLQLNLVAYAGRSLSIVSQRESL